MKMVQIAFPFEYEQPVERILDRQEVSVYTRVGMIEGRTTDGKYHGSKVHPGNLSMVLATVSDDAVDELLEALEEFRQSESAHCPLTACVWPIEKTLGLDEDCE